MRRSLLRGAWRHYRSAAGGRPGRRTGPSPAAARRRASAPSRAPRRSPPGRHSRRRSETPVPARRSGRRSTPAVRRIAGRSGLAPGSRARTPDGSPRLSSPAVSSHRAAPHASVTGFAPGVPDGVQVFRRPEPGRGAGPAAMPGGSCPGAEARDKGNGQGRRLSRRPRRRAGTVRLRARLASHPGGLLDCGHPSGLIAHSARLRANPREDHRCDDC